MKYLCLAYYDEKKFASLEADQLQALEQACQTHDQQLHDSGQLMLVASLAPSSASASIRPRQGEPSITDGPYAETRDQLGAVFIIEASDLNDAIRVASKHPAAHLGEQVGWGIEVRPVEFFQQS